MKPQRCHVAGYAARLAGSSGPPPTLGHPSAVLGHPGAIRFLLPIRLVSGANAREHWRVRARRAQEQRGLARLFAGTNMIRTWAYLAGERGLTVTITRIGPTPLDSDNLAISAKHVRDGIADAAEVDDGSPWWLWRYLQRKPRKGEPRFAAEITIEVTIERLATA